MKQASSAAVQEKAQQSCYHCGDVCPSQPVMIHEKPFCCEGCKTVYEILNENGLCRYYDIESAPGASMRKKVGDRYAFLDNEEIKQQLLTFSAGNVGAAEFYVPAIHCSSCIWLLENLQKLNPGVISSQVNFPKKQVTVTFREQEINLRQLVELMAGIGYEPEINQSTGKKAKNSGFGKGFYYRLGIAGFCFGNIMLLSVPEYLDTAKDIDESYRNFFAYLNLLLALPVFLYCSSDYFISAFKSLRKGYINLDLPISLGILTLFSRSAFEIVTGMGPGFMDSLAGLVFFLLVGKWYQGKTYQALSFERDYESYFPIGITRLVNGLEQVIPLGQLQPHDRIRIRNQELIPADAILVEGEGLIDYSFVTGESEPVAAKKGEKVFAGGKQTGTSIEVVVEKMVSNSYLTRLWNQEAFNKEGNDSFSEMTNRVSRYFTFAILLIATGTAAWWYLHDPSMVALTVTAVLIVACPCALALSLPFTFGNTIRVFGRRGFYLKNSQAVEKLAGIDTIVFDKTGTITHSRPQSVSWEGRELSLAEKAAARALAGNSTHPLSVAIYGFLKETAANAAIEEFSEEASRGISGWVNGKFYRMGSEAFITGEKTSADNRTAVYVAINDEVAGAFRFTGGYREGFEEVINRLGGKYDLHVLSGDNDREKINLLPFFKNEDRLHFNQSPANKLNYIKNLKAQGKKVLMIGDGLNDAGALQEAEVGISISDDIYTFSPACDAILDSSRFASLERFIRFSKVSVKVVKSSYVLSLLYNIVGLSFAVTGLLTPLVCAILMPVSSVTVVAWVTFTVRLMAGKRLGATVEQTGR